VIQLSHFYRNTGFQEIWKTVKTVDCEAVRHEEVRKTVVNYRNRLRPEKFRYLEDDIDKRFDTDTVREYKLAAVLHKMAAEQVDYYSSGSSVSNPEDMVDLQSGDCQDQTVLLGSMMVAAGLDIRIVSVDKISENMGHVLIQVKLPDWCVDNSFSEIRDTHEQLFNHRPGKICCSKINGDRYFLADPEWSSYIGDRSSLTGSYIKEDGDSWTFHNVYNEWMVDADQFTSGSARGSTGSTSNRPVASSSRSSRSGKRGFLDQLDELADAICEL